MIATSDNPPQRYDTVVIGAGPAGCEAALASARTGATTLCLAINLDTVGFPPANPIIVSGPDDPRLDLLQEIKDMGGALPELLSRESIGHTLSDGTLVADRRNLGLAYKELIEGTAGLFPRQTLVTGIRRTGDAWDIETRLGEKFEARAVVVAAGTFLSGEVDDGGSVTGGGRIGEIPAKALARSLESLGIEMVRVKAVNMPRLDRSSIPSGEGVLADGDYRIMPDGSQLCELYLFGPYITGTRTEQLSRISSITGFPDVWMTRAAYGVASLAIAADQVDVHLEATMAPGLFFAGRASGCCNYTEAAATGVIAGDGAGSLAGLSRNNLIKHYNIVSKLCDAVSRGEPRPVTIRIEGPGC